MTNWLSSGIEFDAVISNNDETAIGAIQALKAAGKVIGGVDATPAISSRRRPIGSARQVSHRVWLNLRAMRVSPRNSRIVCPSLSAWE